MGRIVTFIGTRPEIIKMAPVVKALAGLDHEHVLVHSGRHYDLMMARICFGDVQLREPAAQFALKEQPPHLQLATTMRQVAGVTEHADRKGQLARALKAFEEAAEEAGLPIVFPIHPRTAKRLQEFGLEKRAAALPSLRRIDPTGYLDMLILEKEAAIVMTDSGGLQ